MTEFQSTEDLREFILNRQENEEDIIGVSGHCWGLSWKKDRWIIKSNNKKVAEIVAENLPKDFNLRSPSFPTEVLAALRKNNFEGLSSYLEGLNNA